MSIRRSLITIPGSNVTNNGKWYDIPYVQDGYNGILDFLGTNYGTEGYAVPTTRGFVTCELRRYRDSDGFVTISPSTVCTNLVNKNHQTYSVINDTGENTQYEFFVNLIGHYFYLDQVKIHFNEPWNITNELVNNTGIGMVGLKQLEVSSLGGANLFGGNIAYQTAESSFDESTRWSIYNYNDDTLYAKRRLYRGVRISINLKPNTTTSFIGIEMYGKLLRVL